MGIKSWFGGGGSKQEQKQQADQDYTIDDLIVLERYDEACDRLKARLKLNPADLHMHLKLAEVYAGLKQYDKAVTSLEAVIDSRKETANLYAQLAILAAAAKQDRKATLAEQKALALTPAKDRKQLKSEIDLQKSQLTVQQPTQAQSG